MCGILGLATTASHRITTSDEAAARLRDLLRHRGPDGAGLWRAPAGNVVLTHRRLAVRDTSSAAAQPMLGQHSAIIYNGELYNDDELRGELASRGVAFRTASDTETVLAAIDTWGADALPKLRGMFALAHYDARTHSLLLARDPLGIKPLYFWISQGPAPLVLFASEPTPILAHPDVPVRPDLVGVSAYLTSIRTVLGNRTMFEGVRTLRPGEALQLDLSGRTPHAEIGVTLRRHGVGAPAATFTGSLHDAVPLVRDTVMTTVVAHMRADVPTCALLSGGLDSSAIVASMPTASMPFSPGTDSWSNRTYCSGAAGSGNSDFDFARVVAERFHTVHTEAPVNRRLFAERWASMVSHMGVPLSTPNEVAINEVARRLRADGQVVALSGEGADELFAGYDLPLTEAAAFESGKPAGASGGEHQLSANAWIPVDAKPVILSPGVWRAVEHDAALREFYSDEFAAIVEECGDARSPLDPHLRFHRRINLAGLLQRLDSATMLESVEGRTPFADRLVAHLAESLPMAWRFAPAEGETPARTKIVLRRAFEDVLPGAVVERPKASFPLPFHEWVADSASVLRESSFVREFFAEPAVALVANDPARHWRVAWPMINIALWGKRWWG